MGDSVSTIEKRSLEGRSKKDIVRLTAEDLLSYHEHNAGRLVVDPEEAKVEFGEAVTSQLKLSSDGKILWPQPTDDPEDPQNWSDRRKSVQLLIITLASVVPDFDAGIGIASIFALAEEYETTTAKINDLTANWSIFLIGWGGFFAVMLMRRFGRLPVLFWSQLLALGFLVGCALAPNIKVFAAMRCLTAFFGTPPQTTGLFIITDMYPFHLQARKINIWTMGLVSSPFLSPFLLGFLVARADWRWAYGVGCFYGVIVVVLIVLFGEETMFDRTLTPIPPHPTSGLRYRIETLLGITGHKMQKFRGSWYEVAISPLRVIWRPHLLGIMVFAGVTFGFSVGINLTNFVFLGTPKPIGYGYTQTQVAAVYATPVVSVLIGEVLGRYGNDAIASAGIRRNKGVFEAEFRLWMCYIAIPIYIIGFVVIGAAFQEKLSIVAVIFGWGIAQVAIMLNTTATLSYANDCFPKHQGEISVLINLFRTLGGFAVSYFQLPWATKNGALQTFGCEAAIVTGLLVLVVPVVQWKGRALRAKYSV